MSNRPFTSIVLPDLHVPFHNDPLLCGVLGFVQDSKPDQLILSGDFLDMASLNGHVKGSLAKLSGINLSQEYKMGNEVLDLVVGACPKKCKLDYLWGNHEDRYTRFLEEGDTAKVGKELCSPTEALKLRERGFRVHEDWKEDSVKIGPYLEVIHGVYCTDNTAKKHLSEFEGSVIFGHTHRVQSYVSGKRGSYNIGFLGDKESAGFKYIPRWTRNRWINGFAVVYLMDDGSFLVNSVQCWKDRFCVNGRTYQ